MGEPSLVLHGGGNTSVKLTEADVFGEPAYLLYVKGSGWDLATIDAAGFAPVRIDHLLRLARLPQLSDSQMAQELRIATMRADAPAPSVEAILHAILPYKFVDHCHADALIAVMNSRDGEDRIRDLYGDSVVIVPYVMPGFALAKLCAELFASRMRAHTSGIVLLNHGLFTFGDNARSSYERTIELVTKAEDYLSKFQDAGKGDILPVSRPSVRVRTTIAGLRREVSRVAGKPMILVTHRDETALRFAQRPDLPKIALRGPATPDHVIRTKRIPMIGRDVDAFALDYRLYFARNAARVSGALTMLDPSPQRERRFRLTVAMKGSSEVGKLLTQIAQDCELKRRTPKPPLRYVIYIDKPPSGETLAAAGSDLVVGTFSELQKALFDDQSG